MSGDAQRWDTFGTTYLIEHDKGRYVLAADAEAHEQAAVEAAVDANLIRWRAEMRESNAFAREQAIRDCIAEVYRSCGHTKYEGCRPCAHDDVANDLTALLAEAPDSRGGNDGYIHFDEGGWA